MKALLISFAFFPASSAAIAENHILPTLELGASLSTLSIPNYRGSQNSSTYLFPLPYIKYRGDRLKVDEGVQNVFLDSRNLVLSLSGGGTLPVNDDNPERIGMEELAATLELGPSLDYRFATTGSSGWWLELPLRLAFTFNSDFEHIGQVFQPRLAWRKRARNLQQWKLRAAFGPIYSSSEFHDYYYTVNAKDAFTDRPAYQADGGYSGVRGTFSFSKRFGKLWSGGFIRYDSLSNAVVEDSPLVSDKDAWLAGIALGWVFSDSY
ncbi:MAG: MipA/OmpV family protein [Gammaproteobacteria bacterium]|nr:MipA/OmpV family protein [Gammaproteobacteria bacterium]